MWKTQRASPTVLAKPFASDLRFDGGAYAGLLRRKVKLSAAVSRWSYISVCACVPTGRDLDTGSGCGKVKPQLAVIFFWRLRLLCMVRHFDLCISGSSRRALSELWVQGPFDLGPQLCGSRDCSSSGGSIRLLCL